MIKFYIALFVLTGINGGVASGIFGLQAFGGIWWLYIIPTNLLIIYLLQPLKKMKLESKIRFT